jgi:hypothetical protein
MRRRDVITALAGSACMLGGCVTDSDPVGESTSIPTVPSNVTTLTGTKPLPTPATPSSPEAARSFVETHEHRYVYNELVDGIATVYPATEISVEPAQTAVVHTTDRGYYLLSSCSGSARYYDPEGSPSSATRYASSIAHFVGAGTHRRIPFGAYRCRDPVVTVSSGERPARPVARFQLYDFETPPDYDLTEQDGRSVQVTVTSGDDETVLSREYQTVVPLTIQPNVTRRSGRYTLTVSLADGGSVRDNWSLSTSVTPEWWAVAVVITNAGEVVVRTLYPNDDVGLPRETLCRRADHTRTWRKPTSSVWGD